MVLPMFFYIQRHGIGLTTEEVNDQWKECSGAWLAKKEAVEERLIKFMNGIRIVNALDSVE